MTARVIDGLAQRYGILPHEIVNQDAAGMSFDYQVAVKSDAARPK